MLNSPVISLELPPGIHTDGDFITGAVTVNNTLADEKDVVAIRVSLRAEEHTWVKETRRNQTARPSVHHERTVFLNLEQTLWTSELPRLIHQTGISSLPFTFQIPENRQLPLPPSFYCGDSSHGGRVQYYIHAVAVRKSWYQPNIRLYALFPFLPADMTGAPFLTLPNWTGDWTTVERSTEVRQNSLNIFSGKGLLEVVFEFPRLTHIPLFKKIPFKLTVTCKSKLLASINSREPSTFVFPRNPKPTDIEFCLLQRSNVHPRGRSRNVSAKLSLGSRETINAQTNFPTSATNDRTLEGNSERSPPEWLPDNHKSDKGRWVESMTFTSGVTFRHAPPFRTRLIETTSSLDIKIRFPGLGNTIKLIIGPLPITSGIRRPRLGDPEAPPQHLPTELDLPPYYWDVVDLEVEPTNEQAQP